MVSAEEQNIKIYRYQRDDGLITPARVRAVMKYLNILIEEANARNVGGRTVTAEAIVNLRRHCEGKENLDPRLIDYFQYCAGIEPDEKGKPTKKGPGKITGQEIGNCFFGHDWTKKLMTGEALTVEPDVSAIITAAKPRICSEYRDTSEIPAQEVANIPKEKVEHTVGCLKAVLHQALSMHGRKKLPVAAITELAVHAHNPEMKLSPGLFKAVANIQSDNLRLSGEAIGNYLFGEGWREKIQQRESGEPGADKIILAIADPEVRKIIAAAEPEARIKYIAPVDYNHQASLDWVRRCVKQGNERANKLKCAIDFGNHGAEPVPERPGESWTDFADPARHSQSKNQVLVTK